MWKEPTANIRNVGTTLIPRVTMNGLRKPWFAFQITTL